ncbi:MAG TPA: hypothetical protein VEA44_01315 [Caulobacter sp.]|nr:hypothetical protein [Caulobacter sp.]
MVWWWWILPAASALLGAIVLLRGLGALFGGRFVGGLFGSAVGGAFLAIGAVVALAGLDVQTYQRLTYERPVATIETRQLGPQLFEATLTQPPSPTEPAGKTARYQIHGDQWRIEARVLKWKPWANVLGLDSQYRLDRLSGRYESTQDELNAPRSVYPLGPEPGNVDMWAMARKSKRLAPMVDSLYGGGAFMPMANGAKYEVWLTQNGLIARPTNPAAMEAGGAGWN